MILEVCPSCCWVSDRVPAWWLGIRLGPSGMTHRGLMWKLRCWKRNAEKRRCCWTPLDKMSNQTMFHKFRYEWESPSSMHGHEVTRSVGRQLFYYSVRTELKAGVETGSRIKCEICAGVLRVAPVTLVTVVDCWADDTLFHVLRLPHTVYVCKYVCKYRACISVMINRTHIRQNN